MLCYALRVLTEIFNQLLGWMDGRIDGRTMERTTGRLKKSADGLTDHLIRKMF